MAAAPFLGYHDGSIPTREVVLMISRCPLNLLVEIGLGWSATIVTVLATESNEVF